MTNEELKTWLKRCGSTDNLCDGCDGCPFEAHSLCFDEIKLAALALIKKQEKELNQLKTECALLDNELRNARQETINVLNRLKEHAVSLPAIEAYHFCNLVDEMIEGLTKCPK